MTFKRTAAATAASLLDLKAGASTLSSTPGIVFQLFDQRTTPGGTDVGSYLLDRTCWIVDVG